jgi:hypothetical protein
MGPRGKSKRLRIVEGLVGLCGFDRSHDYQVRKRGRAAERVLLNHITETIARLGPAYAIVRSAKVALAEPQSRVSEWQLFWATVDGSRWRPNVRTAPTVEQIDQARRRLSPESVIVPVPSQMDEMRSRFWGRFGGGRQCQRVLDGPGTSTIPEESPV